MPRALGNCDAAGERLGESPWRVREMVRQGLLPPGVAVRLGRRIRVDLDRLEEWIAAGGAALPAPAEQGPPSRSGGGGARASTRRLRAVGPRDRHTGRRPPG